MAFSAGPVVIHPKLTVAESYNDNIFYTSSSPQSAFITGVTPGIDFRLGRLDSDRVFHLNYAFNEYWYHGSPDIDTAQAHNLGFTSTIKGNRLSSDTSVNVAFMNTIYGGVEAFNSGALASSRNIDRFTLDLSQTLRYQTSEKTSGYVSFSLRDLDFRAVVPNYDQNIWKILGGFAYQLRPKVGIFGEIYYGQTANDPNYSYSNWLDGLPGTLGSYTYTVKPPHVDTVGGYVGANIEITTKLTGRLKVGYEQSNRPEYLGGNNFFVPGVPDVPFEIATGGSAIDLGAPVAGVSLKSAITERLSATIGYDRMTRASVTKAAAAYTSDIVRLQLQQILGNAHPWFLNLEANYNLNSYDNFDQIYAINVPGVGSGIVSRPVPSQTSNLVGVGASVAYQATPWLTGVLGYRYLNQHSKGASSSVDYDVNEVYFAISLGY